MLAFTLNEYITSESALCGKYALHDPHPLLAKSHWTVEKKDGDKREREREHFDLN